MLGEYILHGAFDWKIMHSHMQAIPKTCSQDATENHNKNINTQINIASLAFHDVGEDGP